MRMTSYVDVPQLFNALNDNWEFYIRQFKHFLLANKIVDNEEKCHLLATDINAWKLLHLNY